MWRLKKRMNRPGLCLAILHQSWRTIESVPAPYEPFVRSWITHHPGQGGMGVSGKSRVGLFAIDTASYHCQGIWERHTHQSPHPRSTPFPPSTTIPCRTLPPPPSLHVICPHLQHLRPPVMGGLWVDIAGISEGVNAWVWILWPHRTPPD